MTIATWEERLKRYLDTFRPFGVRSNRLEFIGGKNHFHYGGYTVKGQKVCLRMVDPEGYRREEWISAGDEFKILQLLENTGLAPKPYYLDADFSPPLLIEEFVDDIQCFGTDLKPLQDEHIEAAAQAIALLNRQPITPDCFQFRKRSFDPSYTKSIKVWTLRLLYTIAIFWRRTDILLSISKIGKLVIAAMPLLIAGQRMVRAVGTPSFHFDGARCGNTYLRGDGTVVFLDWESVSWRRDPSFTAARFLVSTGENGRFSDRHVEVFLRAYRSVHSVPNFDLFLRLRLLERTIADAVWTLWDAARRRDPGPVWETTNLMQRYTFARELLERQQGK